MKNEFYTCSDFVEEVAFTTLNAEKCHIKIPVLFGKKVGSLVTKQCLFDIESTEKLFHWVKVMGISMGLLLLIALVWWPRVLFFGFK